MSRQPIHPVAPRLFSLFPGGRSRAGILAVAVAVSAACGGGESTAPVDDAGTSRLLLAAVTPATVRTLVLEVTGPGISTAIVGNFPVDSAGGVFRASGSVVVPAGSSRRLLLTARDGGGIVTHRGDTTMNLPAGDIALALRMLPLESNVQVAIEFGSPGSLVITRASPVGINVGDTVTWSASGTGSTGASIPADSIAWASADPSILASLGGGRFLAGRAGSVAVFARSGSLASRDTATVAERTLASAWTWGATVLGFDPTVGWLFGLAGASASDVWLGCGLRCIYRFDGTTWNRMTVDAGANVYQPFVRTVGDVYFSGQSAYQHGEVLRWTGSSISQVATYSGAGGGGEILAVYAYEPGAWFACGDGAFLRYTSAGWQPLSAGTTVTFNSPHRFNAAFGTSASNAYCGGRSGVYRYDGTSVSRVVDASGVNAMAGTGASDVWAVGDTGVVRHYDGVTWATVDVGQATAHLLGVATMPDGRTLMVAADRFWARRSSGGVVQASVPSAYRATGAVYVAPTGRIFLGGVRQSDQARVILTADPLA